MSATRRFIPTGKCAALLLMASSLIMPPVMASQYSASFKGTDINEFINTIGRSLNKTIIIEPNVRGKINVRSYETFNEEQYYQFFLSVLEVYGYAVVEMDNNILKVIKDKDAKSSAIPVTGADDKGVGDAMVTRIVPVYNVPVRELTPILRQLNDNSGGGNIVSHDPSNVIMLTGRAAKVNRIVEMIRRVDKQGDQEVAIVQLKYASAPELVRIIEQIITNSAGGKGKSSNQLTPKLVADERTNSVVVSGEKRARERAVNLVKRLDNEQESSGNTKVVHLKYAQAKEVAQVLTGVADSIKDGSGAQKAKAQSNKRDVNIQAHEDTNSLVITAQPDVMRSLDSVIRQLDFRRAQINVEAIIVEVSEGDGIDLGVQWASEDGGMIQFNNSTPISNIVGGALSARTVTTKGSTIISAEGATTKNEDQTTEPDFTQLFQVLTGVNGALAGLVKGDWGAIIEAVSASSTSNILATPNLTTLDNQEAEFIVGEDVPIITGSSISAGGGTSDPFQTIERREVGIKLKVTPQINEGTSVQLTIEQEVSGVKGGTAGTAVDVIFSKRSVATNVMVDDGEIVVIGGLIDESVQETESKVPLLGDIPILGHLFRSTSSSTQKRNLMIFIKPTIIRDAATMSSLSSRKYNMIRAVQLEQQDDGISLMPFTDQPMLNQLDKPVELPKTLQDFLKEHEGKTDTVEDGRDE
ncbi:type II secretion system secretin GspD [Psychrobium sp. 1_MG-2023]|uniref:type II secretion system secretin GspD n=1 Tax=Psychrobium sp. 1_MG-2023 TaxID=3062624 RepID=UPI000C348907|nr:type II secretion system secretin GspD [Psychrobium sp. 1_MG-2023]MDP2561931.1 type II secretion system secretin GspD [Psychrobium sp. 1_MG-2023]PKF58686.1 type II secretion system protein GspD [Alteromonadales bacterium alter-6D02]